MDNSLPNLNGNSPGEVEITITPPTPKAKSKGFVPGHEMKLSEFQAYTMDKNVQYCSHHYKPPKGFDTIMEVLSKHDPNSVLLRQKRSHDDDEPKEFANEVEFERVTYGRLLGHIDHHGDLRKLGVTEGERVAYICPPGAVGATVFLSIIAQTCAVPLDRRSPLKVIEDAMDQLKVQHFLLFDLSWGPSKIQELQDICDKLGVIVHNMKESKRFAGLYWPEKEVDIQGPKLRTNADDIVCMLRTSGSTGRPKEVPLHQSGIIQNGLALAEVIGLRSTDVNLNTMPLFHIGGLSCCVLASITKGGSLICMDFWTEQGFVEHLALEDPPTWYHAVPVIHKLLVDYCKTLKKVEHSIRLVRSGAANLNHSDAKALQKLWGCPVYPTYSMSEQMPIVQPPTWYNLEKEGTVGVPNCCSMVIMDDDNRPAKYGLNDEKKPITGQVCISGPNVMREYGNNPEANAKEFFKYDGKRFFRTGDVGYLDEEGFLKLCGRSKEVIKTKGGEQISPFEVENVVKQLDWVHDVICFPIENEFLGQQPGLAVVPVFGKAPEDIQTEIRKFCLKNMEPYKVPKKTFKITSEMIPKTVTNKMKRLSFYDEYLKAQKQAQEKEFEISLGGLRGVVYVMSIYLVFEHCGGRNPEGGFGFGDAVLMRDLYLHVAAFFALGGLTSSIALRGNPIKSKATWWISTFTGLYPIYLVAILLSFIQWVSWCHPDNFEPFSYEPTTRCMEPYSGSKYGSTMFHSILIYVFGLQAWPGVFFNTWFFSPYTWFLSCYFFFIFLFPFIYNTFVTYANKTYYLVAGTLFSEVCVILFHLIYFLIEDPESQQTFTLTCYLTPFLWLPTFVGGICVYFMLEHTKFTKATVWDGITDAISFGLAILLLTLATSRGSIGYEMEDNAVFVRLWGVTFTHFMVPVLCVWLYGLCVGEGYTARLFNSYPLQLLAPYGLGVFLFHDVVISWWLLITRGTQLNDARPYYFFSPVPANVMWPEYIMIAMLCTAWAYLMNTYVNPVVCRIFVYFAPSTISIKQEEEIEKSLVTLINAVIGREDVTIYDSLDEVRVQSVKIGVLHSYIKYYFPEAGVTLKHLYMLDMIDDLAQLMASNYNKKRQEQDEVPDLVKDLSIKPAEAHQIRERIEERLSTKTDNGDLEAPAMVKKASALTACSDHLSNILSDRLSKFQEDFKDVVVTPAEYPQKAAKSPDFWDVKSSMRMKYIGSQTRRRRRSQRARDYKKKYGSGKKFKNSTTQVALKDHSAALDAISPALSAGLSIFSEPSDALDFMGMELEEKEV